MESLFRFFDQIDNIFKSRISWSCCLQSCCALN